MRKEYIFSDKELADINDELDYIQEKVGIIETKVLHNEEIECSLVSVVYNIIRSLKKKLR